MDVDFACVVIMKEGLGTGTANGRTLIGLFADQNSFRFGSGDVGWQTSDHVSLTLIADFVNSTISCNTTLVLISWSSMIT